MSDFVLIYHEETNQKQNMKLPKTELIDTELKTHQSWSTNNVLPQLPPRLTAV